jgi:hypothetical protein
MGYDFDDISPARELDGIAHEADDHLPESADPTSRSVFHATRQASSSPLAARMVSTCIARPSIPGG